MRMRGPDASGFWSSSANRITLAHRRLAVLDLDSRADQPMVSGDGRYVIVFNGEIYNFRELRNELAEEGARFITHSDTEVLLELYARDREHMLAKLRGMFAFAIWDNVSKSLFFARDPYGIKPLYLGRAARGWLFASQVKALLASRMISKEPNPLGQAGFWLLGSVPEPHTWFRNISALPAGSWCSISAVGKLSGPHMYFDIGDCWRNAPARRLPLAESQEIVRSLTLDSVRNHLVADVPIGVFLSGGIDSGSLAGLMADAGASSIKGITIAFEEFANTPQDESPVAARIARQFGIEHHVRTISRSEFDADLSRILTAMDQPSIDGINTWFASKAVAELGLKVVISGVGGDELFCGYSSFRQLPRLVSRWNFASNIPGFAAVVNRLMGVLAARSGNPRWRWLPRQAVNLYGAYWLQRGLFSPDQLSTLMGCYPTAGWTEAADPQSLLRSMVGDLPEDSVAAIGQLESMAYLRNQLLRDSDWASMDHGIELRTPLVDAALLKGMMPMLRGFVQNPGKTLLANAPRTPLSREIVGRQKTGFGIPVERWMGVGNDKANRGSRGWARMIAVEYESAI
jgi:asparagine synthase (glutamine-hydrolysing)